MNGLLKRALSGTVYVGLIVAGVLCGPWAFAALSAVLVVLAVNEFATLSGSGVNSAVRLLDIAGGVTMVCSVGGYCAGVFAAPSVMVPYLIYLIARGVIQLYVVKGNALKQLALSLTGQVYAALPLSLMSVIYYKVGTPYLLLGLFIMIWLNDSGAYIVGSRIGRRKLWPRISPKKSWEGFWGGVCFAVVAGVMFGTLWSGYFASLPTWSLAVMGGVVALFATWGDLLESLVKRTVGVKDSGSLIPGHGGILDRIDSLLMVVPSALVYLAILGMM